MLPISPNATRTHDQALSHLIRVHTRHAVARTTRAQLGVACGVQADGGPGQLLRGREASARSRHDTPLGILGLLCSAGSRSINSVLWNVPFEVPRTQASRSGRRAQARSWRTCNAAPTDEAVLPLRPAVLLLYRESLWMNADASRMTVWLSSRRLHAGGPEPRRCGRPARRRRQAGFQELPVSSVRSATAQRISTMRLDLTGADSFE